jgi:hypothetical protein
MDCVEYRNSGELSDLTVEVGNEQFHLHKFPLFVRSNYFKNLASLRDHNDSEAIPTVKLNPFPGGAKTFATIADYCYNKPVDLDKDNIMSVRLAAEYLEMNGNANNTNGTSTSPSNRGGLTALADNFLFDVIYSAKLNRDYPLLLNLIEQASHYPDLVETIDNNNRLIETFADNLTSFVKTSRVYDLCDRNEVPRKQLHEICLDTRQISILNNLPLEWMKSLLKYLIRNGCNLGLVSYIAQNYIDSNTDLNPDYVQQLIDQNKTKNKNLDDNDKINLITIAADILKVDQKLSKSIDDENDKERENSNKSDNGTESKINLIRMMSDIIGDEDDVTSRNPSNLINIASEVRENKPAANDDYRYRNFYVGNDGDSEEDKKNNLLQMTADILETEPKPRNLIKIAKEVKKTDEDADNERSKKSNYIFPKKKIARTNDDKIKLIKQILDVFNEQKVEPVLPIPWILNYAKIVHDNDTNTDADTEENDLKSSLRKWVWNSIVNNNNEEEQDLSKLSPDIVEQLSKDIQSKPNSTSYDTQKVQIFFSFNFISDYYF